MSSDQTTEWMTVAEVAKELRLSKMHMYRLIETGELTAHNFGGRAMRVRRADLDAFIEGSRMGEPQ